MVELIHKRGWDSKVFDTGRTHVGKDKKERTVYGTELQNGLHDEEPDGSFVEVNAKFMDYNVGVSTDRVIRNRCGEVRISDTGSESKDLAKVKSKRGCGVSLKLKGIRTYGPFFDDLKSCYYNTDDGIKLRYYPHYKGVSIVVEISNPQTASNIYRFSLKEYGCDYTYEEIGGAIRCISSTGKDDIIIKATYATDGNGDSGPVYMRLGNIVDGYQEVEKVISPVWLGNAVGPVLSDPEVTIDDSTGTFEDASLFASSVHLNSGGWSLAQIEDGNVAVSKTSNVRRVDLSSYPNITVLNAKYSINITSLGAFAYDYELFPILRQWNEGNKSLATATTGEVTAYSARHGEQLWALTGCNDPGTDRSATSAGDGTLPVSLGWFDMVVTAASVQAKIDNPSTNYGDVMHVKTPTPSASFYRWHSSEGTPGSLPSFYMEYTEAVGDGGKLNGIFGLGRLGIR